MFFKKFKNSKTKILIKFSPKFPLFFPFLQNAIPQPFSRGKNFNPKWGFSFFIFFSKNAPPFVKREGGARFPPFSPFLPPFLTGPPIPQKKKGEKFKRENSSPERRSLFFKKNFKISQKGTLNFEKRLGTFFNQDPGGKFSPPSILFYQIKRDANMSLGSQNLKPVFS